MPASPDSRDAPDVQPPLHPIAPTTNLRLPSPPTTSPVSGAFANYIASNAWHTTGSVSSKVSAIHQRAAAHATVRLTVGESYSTAGPACQFLYPPNVPSRSLWWKSWGSANGAAAQSPCVEAVAGRSGRTVDAVRGLVAFGSQGYSTKPGWAGFLCLMNAQGLSLFQVCFCCRELIVCR